MKKGGRSELPPFIVTVTITVLKVPIAMGRLFYYKYQLKHVNTYKRRRIRGTI
jgi:hypothetical protein